jgi:hypothetical protein
VGAIPIELLGLPAQISCMVEKLFQIVGVRLPAGEEAHHSCRSVTSAPARRHSQFITAMRIIDLRKDAPFAFFCARG